MIECMRFKSHKNGCLLGFADLYIKEWDAEIPGFTLWQKDGKRWVKAPSTKYVNKDGEEKNRAMFYFRNKDHWPAFSEQAKKAIDKWCSENQEKENYSVGASPASSFDDSECPF